MTYTVLYDYMLSPVRWLGFSCSLFFSLHFAGSIQRGTEKAYKRCSVSDTSSAERIWHQPPFHKDSVPHQWMRVDVIAVEPNENTATRKIPDVNRCQGVLFCCVHSPIGTRGSRKRISVPSTWVCLKKEDVFFPTSLFFFSLPWSKFSHDRYSSRADKLCAREIKKIIRPEYNLSGCSCADTSYLGRLGNNNLGQNITYLGITYLRGYCTKVIGHGIL